MLIYSVLPQCFDLISISVKVKVRNLGYWNHTYQSYKLTHLNGLVSLKAHDLLNSINQGDSDEEGSETDEDDNLDDTEGVAEKDDSEAETEDEEDNKEKEVDKKESVSSLIHRKKLCHIFLYNRKTIVNWHLKRVAKKALIERGSRGALASPRNLGPLKKVTNECGDNL